MTQDKKQKYRFVTQCEPLREGDQILNHGEYEPVAEDYWGQTLDFIQPIRRPVNEEGDDLCDLAEDNESDDRDSGDEGPEESLWKKVEMAKLDNLTPMVVADAEQKPMGYFAYIDDKGNWRNSQTKQLVPTPSWHLTRFPDFPSEEVVTAPGLKDKEVKLLDQEGDKQKDESGDHQMEVEKLTVALSYTSKTLSMLSETINSALGRE